MFLINYNSFMLALIIFYSVMPLTYKITLIPIFKPEFFLIIFSFPLLFSIKKSSKKSWVIVFINITFILINILTGIKYSEKLYEYILKVIPFSLFPTIIGTLIIDKKKLNKYLLIFCNLNFFLLLYIVVLRQDMYSNKEIMNYMTFGYWLLPSILFYMYFYIIKNRIIYLILNIFGIIIITLFGSRFTILLSILGSFILKFKLSSKCLKRKILLVSLFSIPILAIIFVNIENILRRLIRICINLNINSVPLGRLLFTLEGSSSRLLTGRDFLFKETLKMIIKNPLGTGVFGFMENDLLRNEGIFYPHNIFLEVMLHMGVGGLVFLGIIFILILRQLKKNKENKESYTLILILCIMNLKLLLTGSYLWEPYFWLLISLMFSLEMKKEN